MPIVVKPTVMVSSTIYDFRDLRSALRYWLGELGCEVLLSEFNDFPKKPDENSYESCLSAIRKADYFVLLIGGRVGGWYDEVQRISITRMEYREAFRLFQQTGKPKPILFVRQEIWDIREDRAALARYLDDDAETFREASLDGKKRLTNHPSKLLNDAEATFEFIREVARAGEMKSAATSGTAFPAANWIHRFGDFSDIAGALRIALGATEHVERKVLVANLRLELRRNLKYLLWKIRDSVGRIADFGLLADRKITGGIDATSTFTQRDLIRLAIFKNIFAAVHKSLSILFIRQSLTSGAFMEFDVQAATYRPSVAHTLLLELLAQIELISRIEISDEELARFGARFRFHGGNFSDEVLVRNTDVGITCAQARQFFRITDLTARLLRWIDGNPQALEEVPAWTPSPFKDEAAAMESEQVGEEDITRWLATATAGNAVP